jgi:hypothetical protein
MQEIEDATPLYRRAFYRRGGVAVRGAGAAVGDSGISDVPMNEGARVLHKRRRQHRADTDQKSTS